MTAVVLFAIGSVIWIVGLVGLSRQIRQTILYSTPAEDGESDRRETEPSVT